MRQRSCWIGAFAICLGACSSGEGEAGHPRFREASADAGIQFRHFTGATGAWYMPEIVGAGVALFDYDGDGDLDIFLVQGTFMDPSRSMKDALFPLPPGARLGNRLFRNELIPSGRLHFTDVTEQAGVGYQGFGMGASVGDYNNDGHPDLYVTNFGGNILYRNNGDGTFTDVTKEAGVADTGPWSTSASWFDYDGDGRLDLFVAHYADFPAKLNPPCRNPLGERDYCGPKVFKPLPSRLFHNLGGGRFEDVSTTSGITAAYGRGLGVQALDFDRDGRLDLYVANDQNPNNLWRNQGNGHFEDVALTAGCALSADGKALSGMGVAAADYDNDGWEDVLVTNLTKETHSLYRNLGRGFFELHSLQSGLSAATMAYTGFGAGFFDYDNDGRPDLFTANGAVEILAEQRGKPHPYRQKCRVYHNLQGRMFADVSETAGPALQAAEVSRGVAFGDLNNDGGVDLVVTNNNGPAWIILNEGQRGHYLLVELAGVKTNRMGLGAEVGLLLKGQRPVWRRAHTDGSFLASSDPRVHFGLGRETQIDGVVVRWTGGHTELFRPVAADRVVKLKEGTGVPWP